MNAKSERFEMRLDPALIERVEKWSSEQSDRPSRAEAMRQLVELGLSHSESEFLPSPVERLSLWMMAEILKQQPGVEGVETSQLVQQAIFGGHFWALDWELTGILHNHTDAKALVGDVVDALDMWNFIERRFENLTEEEKAKIVEEVGPTGENPVFLGFDGNNETEQLSTARFLVEKLGRFERFKDRSFNSHSPTARRYRNMYRVFEPIRAKLADRELNVDEMIQLLRREY